jgi:hypothetical protein
MLKKSLLLLMIILFADTLVMAKFKADAPLVKPVTIPNGTGVTIGCIYYNQEGKDGDQAIFTTDDENSSWMHIDGLMRKLTIKDVTIDTPPTQLAYKTGEYQIYIDTINVTEMPGGDGSYETVKITVEKQGQKTVIKAQGGCLH